MATFQLQVPTDLLAPTAIAIRYLDLLKKGRVDLANATMLTGLVLPQKMAKACSLLDTFFAQITAVAAAETKQWCEKEGVDYAELCKRAGEIGTAVHFPNAKDED